MCGRCGKRWSVKLWTPTAMHCPRCGSGQLDNAWSVIEEQQRLAKKNASEERMRVKHARQP